MTVLDGHRLVRSGPYRLIRHPAYTGALITCAGFGLALGNWLSLAILLIGPIAAFAFRLRIEEAALAERFGSDWEAHRQATWALIPPVW